MSIILLYFLSILYTTKSVNIPVEPYPVVEPNINSLWTDKRYNEYFSGNKLPDNSKNTERSGDVLIPIVKNKDVVDDGKSRPGLMQDTILYKKGNRPFINKFSWLDNDGETFDQAKDNDFLLPWNQEPKKPDNYMKPLIDKNAPDYFDGNHQVQNYTRDDMIKTKLFGLIREAKSMIDKKVSAIDNVHEIHKDSKLYKIGYIVSFINKTHDGIKDLYRYIYNNRNKWDALRILNAYEQLKRANDFLSQTIKVLTLVSTSRSKQILGQNTNEKRPSDHKIDSNIAWSYYDDNMT